MPSAPPAVEELSGCFRNLKRSELIKMFLPVLGEESMPGPTQSSSPVLVQVAGVGLKIRSIFVEKY